MFDLKDLKSTLQETIKGGTGGGLAVGAVAVAGEAGVSAVGLTTGLAALGLGSMLGGLFVVGLIGVAGYKGAEWVIEQMEDEQGE